MLNWTARYEQDDALWSVMASYGVLVMFYDILTSARIMATPREMIKKDTINDWKSQPANITQCLLHGERLAVQDTANATTEVANGVFQWLQFDSESNFVFQSLVVKTNSNF